MSVCYPRSSFRTVTRKRTPHHCLLVANLILLTEHDLAIPCLVTVHVDWGTTILTRLIKWRCLNWRGSPAIRSVVSTRAKICNFRWTIEEVLRSRCWLLILTLPWKVLVCIVFIRGPSMVIQIVCEFRPILIAAASYSETVILTIDSERTISSRCTYWVLPLSSRALWLEPLVWNVRDFAERLVVSGATRRLLVMNTLAVSVDRRLAISVNYFSFIALSVYTNCCSWFAIKVVLLLLLSRWRSSNLLRLFYGNLSWQLIRCIHSWPHLVRGCPIRSCLYLVQVFLGDCPNSKTSSSLAHWLLWGCFLIVLGPVIKISHSTIQSCHIVICTVRVRQNYWISTLANILFNGRETAALYPFADRPSLYFASIDHNARIGLIILALSLTLMADVACLHNVIRSWQNSRFCVINGTRKLVLLPWRDNLVSLLVQSDYHMWMSIHHDRARLGCSIFRRMVESLVLIWRCLTVRWNHARAILIDNTHHIWVGLGQLRTSACLVGINNTNWVSWPILDWLVIKMLLVILNVKIS